MLTIPDTLDNKVFLTSPLNHSWEDKTSSFYYVDAHNDKIDKALWAINHKATFGIATALCEWIFWRLSKHINKPRLNQALEAQWAGIIDKHYFIDWEFDKDYISDPVEGPIWAMLKCIQYPREAYIDGYIFINKKISNLAMLARHISPDKGSFDQWFSHIMKKSADYFPAQYSYKEILDDLDARENEVYDSAAEPPIPRAFFWESNYNYTESENTKLISEFLGSLDYESNTFLVSSSDMINEGFTGTPYQCK